MRKYRYIIADRLGKTIGEMADMPVSEMFEWLAYIAEQNDVKFAGRITPETMPG